MLTLLLFFTSLARATTCTETLASGPPPPGVESIYENQRSFVDLPRAMSRMYARFGREPGVYLFDLPFEWRFYRGARPVGSRYVVTDAALVSAALRSPHLLDRTYNGSPAMVTKAGRRSILMLEDSAPDSREDWRRSHAVMMPFFTPKYVKTTYAGQVREEAAALATAWSGEKVVNRDLEDFTIANVMRPLFGQSPAPRVSDALSNDLRVFFQPATAEQHARARERLEEFVSSAVARARANPGGDLLIHRLLAMNQPSSFVFDQLITIYFAGQLTTKIMLGMALYFLAEHPEWQTRLRDEYRAFTEGRLGLDDLHWIESFLNETLRIYPPVPVMGRYATTNVQLRSYVIPKGQYVSLDVYATLHDPRVWGEDADRFRPERWDRRIVRNGDFCPFGWGPRICIGQHLAMLEGKLLLGEVLSRHRIRATETFRPPDEFMGHGLVHLRDLKLAFDPVD